MYIKFKGFNKTWSNLHGAWFKIKWPNLYIVLSYLRVWWCVIRRPQQSTSKTLMLLELAVLAYKTFFRTDNHLNYQWETWSVSIDDIQSRVNLKNLATQTGGTFACSKVSPSFSLQSSCSSLSSSSLSTGWEAPRWKALWHTPSQLKSYKGENRLVLSMELRFHSHIAAEYSFDPSKGEETD